MNGEIKKIAIILRHFPSDTEDVQSTALIKCVHVVIIHFFCDNLV